MADTKLIVTVSGGETELAEFVQLCKAMQLLGAVGASRTLRVPYDGDGSARLTFDFGATDVTAVESITDDDLEEDEITIGIGG